MTTRQSVNQELAELQSEFEQINNMGAIPPQDEPDFSIGELEQLLGIDGLDLSDDLDDLDLETTDTDTATTTTADTPPTYIVTHTGTTLYGRQDNGLDKQVQVAPITHTQITTPAKHYEPNDPLQKQEINPTHYQNSLVECIQISEHLGFCLGNAIKYLWRAGLKHTDHKGIETDTNKAKWYIHRLQTSPPPTLADDTQYSLRLILADEFMGADLDRAELIRQVLEPFLQPTPKTDPKTIKQIYTLIDDFVKDYQTDDERYKKILNKLFPSLDYSELLPKFSHFNHNELCYLSYISHHSTLPSEQETAYFLLKAVSIFGTAKNVYQTCEQSLHTLQKIVTHAQSVGQIIAYTQALTSLYRQDHSLLKNIFASLTHPSELMGVAGIYLCDEHWEHSPLAGELIRIATQTGLSNIQLALVAIKQSGVNADSPSNFIKALKFLLPLYLAYQANAIL